MSGSCLLLREIDPSVLGERGVQGDIHKPAESHSANLRQTLYRRGVQHAIANHAQATGTFRDKHVAVGKECESPRVIESLRDDRDVHSVRPLTQIPWTVSERGSAASGATPTSAASTLSLPSGSRCRLVRCGCSGCTTLPPHNADRH